MKLINGVRAGRPGQGPESGRPADGLRLFTLAGPPLRDRMISMLGRGSVVRVGNKVASGCRLVVTPSASKLMTPGGSLACYEMSARDITTDHGVAILYAEPTRYLASVEALRDSKPEICAMLHTGDAYEQSDHWTGEGRRLEATRFALTS